jgi:hypothetical protein
MKYDTGWQATEQVLALVKRTRVSIANVDSASVNANGVFHHPATQLAELKAARENIDKAIEIMQPKVGPAVERGGHGEEASIRRAARENATPSRNPHARERRKFFGVVCV